MYIGGMDYSFRTGHVSKSFVDLKPMNPYLPFPIPSRIFQPITSRETLTVSGRGTPPGAAADRYFLFLCGLRGLRSTKAFRFSLKAWTGFVDSPLAQTAQIRPTTRKSESQVLLKPLQSAQNQEVSARRSPWRCSSSADS